MFGLKPSDYKSEPIQVWPENEAAWRLLERLQTQWRMGMGGATGLDYGVMHQMMDRMHLDPEAFDELELQMRILESEALTAMREKT